MPNYVLSEKQRAELLDLIDAKDALHWDAYRNTDGGRKADYELAVKELDQYRLMLNFLPELPPDVDFL